MLRSILLCACYEQAHNGSMLILNQDVAAELELTSFSSSSALRQIQDRFNYKFRLYQNVKHV